MNTIRKVSVVLLTYNRVGMFRDCLDSLVHQNYPKDRYEIIIGDSSTTDDIKTIYKQYDLIHDPRISYFYQERQGLPAARNMGIEHSSGDIVCFIDDDAIADENWILNLTQGFTDEKIGGVAGNILGYNSTGIIEKYGDVLFSREDPGRDTVLPKNNGPCGCNASYRRDVLSLVHGFDPQILSAEDLDIALKIQKSGYSFRYARNAIVFHRQRLTLKELRARAYTLTKYGMKLISDKYPDDYSYSKLLLGYIFRIPYKLALYPYVILVTPFQEDKIFHLARPALDILVSLSRIRGCISALLQNVRYDPARQ